MQCFENFGGGQMPQRPPPGYAPEHSVDQGSPTFLKLRVTFWYRFMRRADSLIHTLLTKIWSICLNYVIINANSIINQCENTDHVHAIIRTSPRATHMVRAGDLVPAGTVLVTAAVDTLQYSPRYLKLPTSGTISVIILLNVKTTRYSTAYELRISVQECWFGKMCVLVGLGKILDVDYRAG